MKTEDRNSSNSHPPKANKSRRFMEVFVIMSVTTFIASTFEDIFFTQVDSRSVLHHVIFISFYMLFTFLYEKYKPV
jgi:hypothetical protein